MILIDRHVPIDNVCSIDEVACQLMDNESAKAAELARKIKQGLRENVGERLFGVVPNSYLAKVATDMKKPNGLVFIHQEDLPQKLYSLKLRDLYHSQQIISYLSSVKAPKIEDLSALYELILCHLGSSIFGSFHAT